jgi:hypothetical protein
MDERETGTKWSMHITWETFSWGAGDLWSMDMILRSVWNFYTQFINNLALYMQKNILKTWIMGTPCT